MDITISTDLKLSISTEIRNNQTFAQKTILTTIQTKLQHRQHETNHDFQDLHWDDIYSAYFDASID